jgi:DNA polymerase III, delta subunit
VEEDSTGHVQSLTPEQANKLLAKPPTQIRVAQIRYLQEQLSHQAGEYPRMVVFCDAASQPAGDSALSAVLPPFDWASLPGADGQQWVPMPLSRGLFNAQSANRFLKTLEEPGPHTYFVFFAQQQDDVLPTVVSRCQVIPFQPEVNQTALYPPELADFWHGWFQRPIHAAVALKQFMGVMQGSGYTAEQTLQQTLAWVRKTQKCQWFQPLHAHHSIQFARRVSEVEEMLSHHVSPDYALLRLFCP